jgi:hypothetical protein
MGQARLEARPLQWQVRCRGEACLARKCGKYFAQTGHEG